MSTFSYNYQYWLATTDQLKDIFLKRRALAELKPPKTNTEAHDIFSTIYIYTNSIVTRLSYLYDVTFQVQKRDLIRKLLLVSTKRLLEVRNELKQLELSEYIYLDNTLIKLKIPFDDVQLLKPFYFPMTRDSHIQDLIDNKIPNVDNELQVSPNEGEQTESKLKPSSRIPNRKISSTEITAQNNPDKFKRIMAATLIKAHEKARKSRLWMTNIRLHPDKFRPQAPNVDTGFHYEFTHRLDQPMLIPLKRTFYQSNYFLERETSQHIDFYESPARRKLRLRELKQKPSGEENMPAGNNLKSLDGEEDHALAEEVKQSSSTRSLSTLLSQEPDDSAVRVIQAAWRRYKLNKRIKIRQHRKQILYGMISDWTWNKRTNKDIEEDRVKLRDKKVLYDKKFIEAVENEKARIIKVRGPWIMEDISEHIRAWFREFYDGTGEFDRYPEEFEGGTILVLRGETPTVDEYIQTRDDKKNRKKMSAEDKEKERQKRKAEREKLNEKAKKEKALAKLQKLREAKMGKTYDFSELTENELEMELILKEYQKNWDNIDEETNVNENPYMEWISSDQFAGVHQELRVIVDRMMRIEFELLRQSLAEDRKKKYKPQKLRKQKKKKGKRGQKGKKEPKDLTADRTIDSLYHEIKSLGLIKKTEPTNLDSYIGDYNFSAYEKRTIFQMDPPPGQGEIKELIRETILGMGPLDLPKPKSLLLTGPPRSGKKFLVQAIASEIDALVLDISPENVTQFQDNMKYFLHLINKMSRALQPTILFINRCERLFWKKVPKPEAQLKPRLLGKYIVKQIIKRIKPDDKVLVIGISDEPFKGKLRKMRQCFERTIIVPRTDYGTAFQLNRAIGLSKYGFPRDFEFSAIAMVTKGLASSVIYDNVNATLDIERRIKFPVQPLKAQEFIEGYLTGDEPQFPISDKDFSKYTKFYTKANKLAKQRAKLMKEQDKIKAKENAQRKK